jgi:hypothetical protein
MSLDMFSEPLSDQNVLRWPENWFVINIWKSWKLENTSPLNFNKYIQVTLEKSLIKITKYL